MRFYDAHNHLHDDRWPDTLAERLESGRRAGIQRMVVNGTREADWAAVARAADAFPDAVIPSFGLHPWFVPQRSPDWLSTLRAYIERYSTAGVGEIGLDRWKEGLPEAEQEEVFRQQLQVVAELNRPASIHCLRAWGRLVEIVETEPLPTRGFLLHSYGGSAELVDRLAKCGAYFSFPGAFAREQKVRQRTAFQRVPLDRLLIETDSPYLAPAPHRGKPNEPAWVVEVAECIAAERGISLEEVAMQTTANFYRLFHAAAPDAPAELRETLRGAGLLG